MIKTHRILEQSTPRFKASFYVEGSLLRVKLHRAGRRISRQKGRFALESGYNPFRIPDGRPPRRTVGMTIFILASRLLSQGMILFD